MRQIFLGFDPRLAEISAFAVARHSIQRHLTQPIPVRGLVLADLQAQGIYTRPTERRNGKLIDELSRREGYDGAMSTEFAISRFLVPHLAECGWALFMDGDILVRADLNELFRIAESSPEFAVFCVKHDHRPAFNTKMDGQQQAQYSRKNWSSVCLWNVDHPSNKPLTLSMVNSLPGKDLHRFCWLQDQEIGELGPEWNYLVGNTKANVVPAVVHFTEGVPTMAGYENCEYADEWRAELNRWAS